jgi:hypothetical protein
MTTININSTNPINQFEPSTEYIMYYGGAAYYPDEGQEMEVIGTYDSFYDDPAMINFNYGEGRVVLIGPHPEIEEDSTRDGVEFGDDLIDLGTDWNIMWTCMDWLLGLSISEPPSSEPPNVPDISGPKIGRTGAEIEYTFSSDDPECEELYFRIDWGDGEVEDWIGPFVSGEKLKLSHIWSESGKYSIKVKAKDINDLESDWGTLNVNIPRNRIITNSFFQLFWKHFTNLIYITGKIFKISW